MTQTFTKIVTQWLTPKGYSEIENLLQPTKFNGPVYEFSLTEQDDNHMTFEDTHGGTLRLTIEQRDRPCLIILHTHFAKDEHSFYLSN
jgi:hypothetical protein